MRLNVEHQRHIEVSAREGSDGPRWLRVLLLAIPAVCLLGVFSKEIADPDFWLHLKSGQYICEQRALPVPDPFSFTTATAKPTYAGELRTRRFNLTHEWLAQVAFYLVYRVGGFGGVVLFRAAVLLACCGLIGLVAYRRCGGFYRALAAAFAAAAVIAPFAADRPYIFTYLFLAATLAILELRRFLWLLPALFLVWANSHGGHVVGWVVVGAYSAEALFQRLRHRPIANDRELWVVSILCVLVSGINPNAWHVVQVLRDYRASSLTSRILEWLPPSLWPLSAFSVLLFGAAVVLLWRYRDVRVRDWLLFLAFAAASLQALRNVFLIGCLAPILVVSYVPWKFRMPSYGRIAVLALAAAALVLMVARGDAFQLRAANWKDPAGAADFLVAHHITQPMFNTYENGAYLTWRLWPQERVFIDGSALSEAVFHDYSRIIDNVDHNASGKSAEELLDDYGIQVLVLEGFEYYSAQVHLLVVALSAPAQAKWKLVYSDAQAVVFMRNPPPDFPTLNWHQVFDHMEAGCRLHLEHEPQFPRCALNLSRVYAALRNFRGARQWLEAYLALPHEPNPEAEAAYKQMVKAGY
jgi:hypothetical protein